MSHWKKSLLQIAVVACIIPAHAQSAGSQPEHVIEKDSLTLHLLLHPIGEERYQITRATTGDMVMSTSFEYSDRGRKRTIAATLRMQHDLSPKSFDLENKTSSTHDSVIVHGGTAAIREGDASRETDLPAQFFVGSGSTLASLQMMMLRYWKAHGKPARLPILRANPAAQAVEIRPAGRFSLVVDGKDVALQRYTVANVVFGREVLWLNSQGRLAALMTFAGGLPFEAVRKEYEPGFSQLVRDGIAQEMKDLGDLQRQVPVEAFGSFAITGGTLIDVVRGAAIPDSAVIIRDGRIVAAGPLSQTPIPRGMKVVNAKGKTIIPGLWEMHTHFSGVEFGPALLAAGITTARDCGGEFEFLTTIRDEIETHHRLGPRLLLAGLIDASGPDAFGAVSVDKPEEAHAVVEKYHAAGFQQLKLYTLLKPEVVGALSAEAHRAGMTVTGHVPSALNALQGVEAGMDQINHLGFVTPVLHPPGDNQRVDLNSAEATKAISLFQQHHTVIDPTISWGEMASHPKDLEISSFEPGIAKAPFVVGAKYIALGSPPSTKERFQERTTDNLAVIGALHKAGIPIVAGSDTGLIGYGLDRELELYVQAGMSPLEALQTATIIPARVMNLEKDSGTIEPGKRADLILVDGNPLGDISNVRKVSQVVANGRLYDSAKLWESVGFLP